MTKSDSRGQNNVADGDSEEGGTRFEVETVCNSVLIETWHVTLADVEGLTDDEIADLIADALGAGEAELVGEKNGEEETDRELRRSSVERL